MDLLELLVKQHTGREEGVRLTFLPALVNRPTLEASPYIYCAVTNNLALCCLLHARNVLPQQPIVVAAFSAGGRGGVTPWQKRISVSSAETALMAGHGNLAEALALIEAGVPLYWSRNNHSRWPKSFKCNVRKLVAACISSPGFCALPGPVRIASLDLLVSAAARALVWGMLPRGVWAAARDPAAWENLIPDSDLLSAARALPTGRLAVAAKLPAADQRLPQYHFRVARPGGHQARLAGARRMLCALARGGLFSGMAVLAATAATGAAGAFPAAALGAMASAAACKHLLH